MKFLHLSDLHFSEQAKDNTKLDTMFRAIAALYPDHCLIITGDITDDGHVQQYKYARKALEPYKSRLFICPGNHDYGGAGIGYKLKRANLFDQELAIPLAQGDPFAPKDKPVTKTLVADGHPLMLIALNTCLKTGLTLDFARGEVGEPQLKALRGILQAPETRDVRKILFFHHHLFEHAAKLLVLNDAHKLRALLKDHPVDLVLFGHLHKTGAWAEKTHPYADRILAAPQSPQRRIAVEITFKNNQLSISHKKLCLRCNP